jgi:hypothetical protein
METPTESIFEMSSLRAAYKGSSAKPASSARRVSSWRSRKSSADGESERVETDPCQAPVDASPPSPSMILSTPALVVETIRRPSSIP